MALGEPVRASLNMNSLCAFARSVGRTSVSLPSGKVLSIASLTVRFPPAVPARLTPGILRETYTVKPLVDVGGGGVFGELAIVACLTKDGWSALWADTFHGQKFWSDMPHLSTAVTPPPAVRKLYDRIANGKGGAAGCFDVVACKDGRIVWLEYKGPEDKPNSNEGPWLDAAVGAGVLERDLVLVSNEM